MASDGDLAPPLSADVCPPEADTVTDTVLGDATLLGEGVGEGAFPLPVVNGDEAAAVLALVLALALATADSLLPMACCKCKNPLWEMGTASLPVDE